MKIGTIDLGNRPLLLAPMEDVTDIGFRQMCKRFGAAMVYTEFVSADAIIRNIDSTLRKMVIDDRERPVGVQIYGRDVASMVEAARIVEQVHPDVIDINFGCPVKKVAGKGAGAGMLRNIPLLLEITRAVVDAVKVPVTVKTRLGWDKNRAHHHLARRATAGLRHSGAHHPWKNPQPDVHRRGRLDADRRGEGKPAHPHPHHRQWRRDNTRDRPESV